MMNESASSRGLGDLPTLLHQGCFCLNSLDDCYQVAKFLGSLGPATLSLGLQEMLINALEHGNLEIGYEEKTQLLAKGQWQQEIERRLALPQNQAKQVRLIFERRANDFIYEITDDGIGFDWSYYLSQQPSLEQRHGRGIVLATTLCFDEVDYVGCGNKVICRLKKHRV